MADQNIIVKPPPKKRGRKPKIRTPEDIANDDKNIVKVHKKRGRKPKGGKIITNTLVETPSMNQAINIILHLKCNSSNINQKNCFYSNINSYTTNKTLPFSSIANTNEYHDNKLLSNDKYDKECYDAQNIIHKKVRDLSIRLHTNNIANKRSACFWCSHDFDNPPIYIPKNKLNEIYQCYGCFCSPECATAFLFKESINTSLMFKRYHLLNYIYGKIYNYEKNFQPAPDPYYTLDKYYGNLTIDEYRKLTDNKLLLFIVDKPLTRILPELHEDNEDFILNSHSIPSSGKYTLRKKQKLSKKQILNDNFNLTN
jgi:hypothetical protein